MNDTQGLHTGVEAIVLCVVIKEYKAFATAQPTLNLMERRHK